MFREKLFQTKQRRKQMKYKSFFHFFVTDGNSNKFVNLDLTVDSFEVQGGASRVIDLKTTDDISLASEFEQARTFKNITLYLPPTSDHRDMEAALALTEIAINKSKVNVMVSVQRFEKAKMLEGLALIDQEATLKKRPQTVPPHLLMVEINLPAGQLYRGKIQGTRINSPEKL
jgi:hypothetical protein